MPIFCRENWQEKLCSKYGSFNCQGALLLFYMAAGAAGVEHNNRNVYTSIMSAKIFGKSALGYILGQFDIRWALCYIQLYLVSPSLPFLEQSVLPRHLMVLFPQTTKE